MARVAITEYAAKKLVFGDEYVGVTATTRTIERKAAELPGCNYIVKIDTGLKKRGKQGLVRLNVAAEAVASAATELFDLGYERVIIEPMVPHEAEAERYISLDLVRDGVLMIRSEKGGVDIEDANEAEITRTVIPRSEVLAGAVEANIDGVPLQHILDKMQEYHFSFLEINPYIAVDDQFIALDMAVEIDSAKEAKLPHWVQKHVLHKHAASPQEERVLELDARTQAALNLHTLNENGSILTLLSGGGASLVGLDSLVTAGLKDEVINYSEYSGAPTREETEAYVSTLLEVLFNSTAKKKVILIAGGVANFTDVMATFEGIVDAFSEKLTDLQTNKVYVCVRRGGPNQEAGLAHLRDWLDSHHIPNDVHDPSLSLGEVGTLIKNHV